MAELKFFHKLLIFVAVLLGFWKLSKIKFPKREKRPVLPVRYQTSSMREPTRKVRSVPTNSVCYRAPAMAAPSIPTPARSAVVIDEPAVNPSCNGSIHIDDATFRRFYG